MNPKDTAALVDRIVATWPTGVKGFIWTQTLTPLEQQHAETAYIELRDHEERPPSIARFMATYHAHRHITDRDEQPDRCELCDGTGWVQSPPDDRHPGYSFVQPCRCTRGHIATGTHARILEQNTRDHP